jgi:hypothetical protein
LLEVVLEVAAALLAAPVAVLGLLELLELLEDPQPAMTTAATSKTDGATRFSVSRRDQDICNLSSLPSL